MGEASREVVTVGHVFSVSISGRWVWSLIVAGMLAGGGGRAGDTPGTQAAVASTQTLNKYTHIPPPPDKPSHKMSLWPSKVSRVVTWQVVYHVTIPGDPCRQIVVRSREWTDWGTIDLASWRVVWGWIQGTRTRPPYSSRVGMVVKLKDRRLRR